VEAAALGTATGPAGTAIQAPPGEDEVAVWVIYPTDDTLPPAVAVMIKDEDDDFVFTMLSTTRDVADQITVDGMGPRTKILPVFAAPMDDLWDQQRAISCTANIVRITVSGAYELFPLGVDKADRWNAIITTCASLEGRVN
jgi:hypothetical protein